MLQKKFIVESYLGETGSTHYLKIVFGVVVLSYSFRMRVGVWGFRVFRFREERETEDTYREKVTST